MTVYTHSISRESFDALAEGGGGPGAIHTLADVEYSRNLLLLRGVAEEAEQAGADQARLARDAYALLTAIQHRNPLVVGEVLRYPAVGAWLFRTMRALRGEAPIAGAAPAALGAVAVTAAILAGVPAEMEMRPVAGVVQLPSLGAAMVDALAAKARVTSEAVKIVTSHGSVLIPSELSQPAPGWLPLRHIREGTFHVLVDDLDPFRMPAVSGTADRLSTAEMSIWRRAIQLGWELLAARHPNTSAEVQTMIKVIVPLASPPRGLVSSSSSETFGAIALSMPPDPHACAVTLAHELQHLKLSALLNTYPLLLPDDGRRYYAPWRPDPRPLDGLLQGAYAYVGVCRFWQRERHLAHGPVLDRANQEFALWRMGVARAIDSLMASARLTPVGVQFVEGMARSLSSWQDEPVPVAAQWHAIREARDHMSRWERVNGRLRT